jgi:uncharacterized protein YjbJ (UPF0337 family)
MPQTGSASLNGKCAPHASSTSNGTQAVQRQHVGGEQVTAEDRQRLLVHPAALLVARRSVDHIAPPAEGLQRLENRCPFLIQLGVHGSPLPAGRVMTAVSGMRSGQATEGASVDSSGEEATMGGQSGPEAGVRGVVEDVKGKAKEAIGAVTGREEMKREGQAQQHKADAQRDVAQKEAEAEKARAEATAHETEQRSHQDR